MSERDRRGPGQRDPAGRSGENAPAGRTGSSFGARPPAAPPAGATGGGTNQRADNLPPASANRPASRPAAEPERSRFDDEFDLAPPAGTSFGRRSSRASSGRLDAEDPLSASAWE